MSFVIFLLFAFALPAAAQLSPQEVSFVLGDKAWKNNQWDDVVTFWQPLLNWEPWTFPGRSRDEATLAVATSLCKLQRYDECAALLRQLDDTRKDQAFAVQVSAQMLTIRIVTGTKAEAGAALEKALHDHPMTAAELTLFLTGVGKSLGAGAPLDAVVGDFLAAHPHYPDHRVLSLALVNSLAALGDHQDALARGLALLPELAGSPDEAPLVTMLAGEEAQLGHPERAESRMAGWAKAHPSAEMTALVAGYHQRAVAFLAEKATISRALPAVCDDASLTTLQRQRALRALLTATPGALYALDESLASFLAHCRHHPWRVELVMTEAQLLAEAGDHRLAMRRVQALEDEVSGTDDEPAAAVFLAQETGKSGDHAAAFHALYALAPFYPQAGPVQTALIEEALQLPSRALPEFPVFLTRAAANPSESVIFGISVLCERAIKAGDAATARRWSALLDKVAHDHPRAARARKMLQAMGN